MRRDVDEDEDEGQHGRRNGDEEDRAPPERLQKGTGDDRADNRATAAQARPQRDSAHACLTRSPQCRDQRERGRVGETRGHAREDPPSDEDVDRRSPSRDSARRQRERHAEEEHELAAIAVTERPEVEHRHRQAQGAADRDEVDLSLASIEGLADIGEGDIRHAQIEIGDDRREDQRGKR